MKNKIFQTILPTIIGILTVLGLLIIINLILYKGDFLRSGDSEFFKYFVPIATIFAAVFQRTLILPLWGKFKSRNKIWSMTLLQIITLISIVAGLAFGLVFWEPSYGINDLLVISLTGIIAFGVYFICNLFTLRLFDKLLI